MKLKTIRKSKAGPKTETLLLDTALDYQRQSNRFKWISAAVIFIFSVYLSVLYFGHQVMPTSDFPAFYQTGQQALSGHMPGDLKRGPVLGVLQVIAAKCVGGDSAELTGGWMLNAILFPLGSVFLFLVAYEIVGVSAVWLSLICIINARSLQLLADPIAETALLSFIAATYYLIFRGSRWSYLLAAMASMLRYECAALILAAFVVDVVRHKEMRQRVQAFGLMIAASVPLGFWMAATLMNWQSQEASHYLKVFTPEFSQLFKDTAIQERVGLVKHLTMLWQVGFAPMFEMAGEGQASYKALMLTSQLLALLSFVFGTVWAVVKRNWNVIALLVFFVPYVVIHSQYPYLIPRYYQTVFWMALIVVWYGLQSGYGLLTRKVKIPVAAIIAMQAVIVLVALMWVNQLYPYLEMLKRYSAKSFPVPYAAMAVLGVMLIAHVLALGAKRIISAMTVTAVMLVIVMSNQFTLAQVVSDGQRDAEFKELAGWYLQNAKPGEKISLYMAHMTKLYASGAQDCFVSLPRANDQNEFIKKCIEENIRYVVWATREGSNPRSEFYQLSRLDNIAPLQNPADVGPFKFVTQIGTQRGYVNVFRLDANGIK